MRDSSTGQTQTCLCTPCQAMHVVYAHTTSYLTPVPDCVPACSGQDGWLRAAHQ
jgi:hypothetical protein